MRSLKLNSLFRLWLIMLLLVLLTSCAHNAQDETEQNLPIRSYMNDQVTVKAAIMQAHSGYLRGCLEAHQGNQNSEKSFKDCKEKADFYIESDVISILDQ